ncbi:MAG: hypothetical protein CL932_03045 [Deltaproteobacteria bacterium]|nr:hypothetical protein [Deltaproteobacteria bacterium]
MTRTLRPLRLKNISTLTHEGAQAYDYSQKHPLIHLTFTMGSALFTDGHYHRQEQEVHRFAQALLAAYKAEPLFPWQYGAWVRDPFEGKGNRIQGTLTPAILDGLLDETSHTQRYVELCLKHRVDDVLSFYRHYETLGLGGPSRSARYGMANALTHFDEYQLMKYAAAKSDLRLCDVIYILKEELQALGDKAQLVLDVGRYLHAPGRKREALSKPLPLTTARKTLFRQTKSAVYRADFFQQVKAARPTWEQLIGQFGISMKDLKGDERTHALSHNAMLWQGMLSIPRLLPDLALLRNIGNIYEADISREIIETSIKRRSFRKLWPHQIYAAYQHAPQARPGLELLFQTITNKLPEGRHLGIGDASGSMTVRVGGIKSKISAMDVAFCLVGLMSESSGLGASFSDNSWFGYTQKKYLHIAKRSASQSALAFSFDRRIRFGMGGTQVFGAVIELIVWLKTHPEVQPPDCLWFFSDMQFHPAEGATDAIPPELHARARQYGLGQNAPPLELALRLYREQFGRVDVVLWNLAAYAPVPVPADIEGVLLVSGFDANTLDLVKRWRDGKLDEQPLEQGQEVILEHIRSY